MLVAAALVGSSAVKPVLMAGVFAGQILMLIAGKFFKSDLVL